MSDYIKYMYREYLEGRTRIKKVNEDQPLFPNTGAGLLIQKNKLTDDWTALNVSDGHYEEESFNHEALAAAFLQGANMGQLRMLNEILDRARLNGPYCLENVADALLSFAPACKAESLIEKILPAFHRTFQVLLQERRHLRSRPRYLYRIQSQWDGRCPTFHVI